MLRRCPLHEPKRSGGAERVSRRAFESGHLGGHLDGRPTRLRRGRCHPEVAAGAFRRQDLHPYAWSFARAGSAHLKQGEQHGGNQRDDPNSDVSFRSKKSRPAPLSPERCKAAKRWRLWSALELVRNQKPLGGKSRRCSVRQHRQVHGIAGQRPGTDVLLPDARRAVPAFRTERRERDMRAPPLFPVSLGVTSFYCPTPPQASMRRKRTEGQMPP